MMRLVLDTFFLCSIQALTTERRDGRPKFPYDDNTTVSCSHWVDYDGAQQCTQMLDENWTNLDDFSRWVRHYLQ